MPPRILQAALAALLLFSCAPLLIAGQDSPPTPAPATTRPKKQLTPEQIEAQQQYQTWVKNHQRLQAQGKDILAAEAATEAAGDCKTAQSTVDFDECFGKALDVANTQLGQLEDVIKALQISPPRWPGEAPAPAPGPAGPAQTDEQSRDEFDQVEHGWQSYRKTACSAALHQFDGGTGGAPFELQCELKLTRDHLRDLNFVYGNILHL